MIGICRKIGEPHHVANYDACLKCTERLCPVKHLLERVARLEKLLDAEVPDREWVGY